MASTQETSTSIIKSDRAGRTRYSRAYKLEVVAAYEHSGMSAAVSDGMADNSVVDAYCLRFAPAKRGAPTAEKSWLSLLHNALP